MINEYYAHKFCKDDITKIENYDKAMTDTTQTWHLHHILELTLDGKYAHSREELKRLGMYYNRPYFELLFLTHSEHNRLHRKGKHRSDKTRHKISESHKGKHPSNKTRKKMSEARKGIQYSEETRQKMSEAQKGKNLSEEHRRKISETNRGRIFTDEHRRNLSEAAKRRWSQQGVKQ